MLAALFRLSGSIVTYEIYRTVSGCRADLFGRMHKMIVVYRGAIKPIYSGMSGLLRRIPGPGGGALYLFALK